jgi:hypothetical protein
MRPGINRAEQDWARSYLKLFQKSFVCSALGSALGSALRIVILLKKAGFKLFLLSENHSFISTFNVS